MPAIPSHVVGIGASAGGIDSLSVLLPLLVPTGTVAYVIAQHMARDGHAELMTRVLSQQSTLPVQLASDDCLLQPDIVYLLPAGVDGEVLEGRLKLVAHAAAALSCPSVTRLFNSLAAQYGERSIAVVLSGTGSDGAVGCQNVVKAGGTVLVEYPDTAQYGGMPQAALDAVGAGHAHDLRELAQAIWQKIPGLRAANQPKAEVASREALINTLMDELYAATGADFRDYKEETLLRRTARRSEELHLPSLQAYLDHARCHPAEYRVLQEQLYVTVSSFFRDPDAFAALQIHLRAAILAQPVQPFVVWVAGCGSGEEVWSLAMLLHDIKQSENWPGELRVIGTDLNEAALAQARAARYAEKQLLAMPEAFRGRYMTSAAGYWQVVPEIQALCRFETGDVCVQNPAEPLALVSCRNLLIYLKTSRQETLLRRLHGRLRDDGLLFLGQAESLPPGSRALFAAVDADHRIYRKRTQPT